MRLSSRASWSDASHISSFASGCTRRSEMREDCSCMSIREMRGLVAPVSSMKWRRKMVCTRRKATCVDFSWQRTVSREDPGSCRTQCIIEELSKRCYNKGGQAKNHIKNFVVAVLKGLKRGIDSEKAIGSMEVGVTCEEPNVPCLDESAEELQNVLDSISGVRLDPELLSASRKVEIDLMNRLEV